MKHRSIHVLSALALLGLPVLAACGDDDDNDPTNGSDVTTTSQPDGTATTQPDGTATTTPDVAGDTGDTTVDWPCDPVAQTGCTEAQNCTFSGGDAAPACYAEGTVPYGQPCGGEDRCERGVCLDLNETELRCYRFCEEPAGCPGDDRCLALTNGGFSVCELDDIYQVCNLLTQDCVDADKACYSVSGRDEPICLPEGDVATGGDCDDASACVQGDICLNDKCRRLCDVTAETDPCGALGTCTAWDGDAGFCQPPANP